MAAGIITRDVSQIPARLQPIVVDWYNDEINMIVLAHNELFTAYDALNTTVVGDDGHEERLDAAEATITDMELVFSRVPSDAVEATASPHTMDLAHSVVNLPLGITATPTVVLPDPTGYVGGERIECTSNGTKTQVTITVTAAGGATSTVKVLPGHPWSATVHMEGGVPYWVVSAGERALQALVKSNDNLLIAPYHLGEYGLFKMILMTGTKTLTLPSIAGVGARTILVHISTISGVTVNVVDAAGAAVGTVIVSPLDSKWLEFLSDPYSEKWRYSTVTYTHQA